MARTVEQILREHIADLTIRIITFTAQVESLTEELAEAKADKSAKSVEDKKES
jgi:hypothetical protein